MDCLCDGSQLVVSSQNEDLQPSLVAVVRVSQKNQDKARTSHAPGYPLEERIAYYTKYIPNLGNTMPMNNAR